MKRLSQFRSIGFFVALAICSATALGQTWSLGPATAVDVRIQTAQWQPTGEALLYSRPAETGEGTGVGIFMPGQKEGKIVLNLAKGDFWNVRWFGELPGAVVSVYRLAEAGNEMTIYLLDGKTQTAKTIFFWRGAKGVPMDLEMETSPTMVHAVFQVSVNGRTAHYVLPVNGSRLVPAPDIDEAVRQGYSGPTWSVDGTAVYGQGGSDLAMNAQVAALLNSRTQTAAALWGNTTNANEKPALASILLTSFRPARPQPIPGSEVYEVVPSNAVLRPVRFRGVWESPAGSYVTLGTRSQVTSMAFGISKTSMNSLWLVPGGQNSPNQGYLVAPGAGKSWIAPLNRGVAYLLDGALFVRMFKQN